ncbi:MAG TPA: dehydrogenase [candidate division WOR-3 bacterium]|uniref:Dehydrogenase n=1 Tax=candidate division WOR-3 bacterium TaxID=2052148 RepID=A0A7V0Q6M4_UNCW3|nr:dehydrogenase [candidate division WOR-3 bacterium]
MRSMVVVIISGLILSGFIFEIADAQGGSPILWKGKVCENIEFQKTTESVYMSGEKIYAGCGYVDSVKGVLWYKGNISAFSRNGTKLWTQEVGFVRKIADFNGKLVIGVDISRGLSNWFGTLGKIWLLSENGSILVGNITFGSFFDFDSDGEFLYIGDGWWVGEGKSNETWGRVYKWKMDSDNFVEEWFVELNGTIGRVRVGDIIYAGAGAPSGYVMKHYFGYVYGLSKDGKLLWRLNTTWWVRDLELWNGDALVGTGFENVAGKLYLIDSAGKIKWMKDLFYIEDIEVSNNVAYVGGIKGQEGRLAAIDLTTGNIMWEASFPYRVKVIKEYNGNLLVGIGKFSQKQEENRTVIYTEGKLYVISAENGKILADFDTGYVRSITAGQGIAVIGTGSGEVYVFNLQKVIPQKSSICGVGVFLLLMFTILLFRNRD